MLSRLTRAAAGRGDDYNSVGDASTDSFLADYLSTLDQQARARGGPSGGFSLWYHWLRQVYVEVIIAKGGP